MWKVTGTMDDDKDSAMITATFYADYGLPTQKAVFAYSRRVSLYVAADKTAFTQEARQKKNSAGIIDTRLTNHMTQMETSLNTV